jgi:hypothetical protein
MFDSSCCQSFEEVKDGIVVPMMKRTGKDVESHFADQNIEYSFK